MRKSPIIKFQMTKCRILKLILYSVMIQWTAIGIQVCADEFAKTKKETKDGSTIECKAFHFKCTSFSAMYASALNIARANPKSLIFAIFLSASKIERAAKFPWTIFCEAKNCIP